MTSEMQFKTYRLGDVVNVVDYVANGSFAALKENVTYLDCPGYAMLMRTVDFNGRWNGNYVWVDEKAFNFLSKSKLVHGDLVLSNVGSVGVVFEVPNFSFPMTLGPNSVMLRSTSVDVYQKFLYYYFSSGEGQSLLKSISTGSVQAKFNKTDLRNSLLHLPNLEVQKKATSVLATLDEGITLLRETNTTLEAIAQALFKSWFVDFDPVRANSEGKLPEGMDEATAVLFPDAFDETELGMVPRGWEVKAIGEILNRPRITKRYTKNQIQIIGNTPVYEQGASILLGFHNDEPSCNATPEMPLFIFGDHTCVTKLSCEPFDVSQNVIVLEGSVRNSIWTYFAIKGKQKFEEYRRHWMELIAKKVVVPPSALCDFYSDVATPHQLKIDANLRKIQTLTNMRDTLLPRLISEQLRIADAEAEIEKASA